MRYAQIDQNGLCFAVSDLHSAVTAPNMIHVADNENPLGATFSGGSWTLPPKRPVALKFKQFVRLLISSGAVTPAAWAAAKKDDNLAVYFDILREGDIDRGTDFNNGCATAFIAAGLITTQGKAAIMADWPKE